MQGREKNHKCFQTQSKSGVGEKQAITLSSLVISVTLDVICDNCKEKYKTVTTLSRSAWIREADELLLCSCILTKPFNQSKRAGLLYSKLNAGNHTGMRTALNEN